MYISRNCIQLQTISSSYDAYNIPQTKCCKVVLIITLNNFMSIDTKPAVTICIVFNVQRVIKYTTNMTILMYYFI